jgi:hypothetical protein
MLILASLLAGCRDETSPPADPHSVPTADTGTPHTGAAPPAHSGRATAGTAATADTGVVEELVASPPPGTFDVLPELNLSGVSGTIVYTLDGSVPEFGVSAEATGPIALTGSTLVRARGLTAAGEERSFAGAWLALDPGLSGFDGELPVLIAWTDVAAPVDKSDVFTPFSLSVFERTAGVRTVLPATAADSGRAGLRVRGSSTAGYAKHPYRLELWDDLDDEDRDDQLLGMPSDGDWVLAAPADFDRALMRNSLAFALSNNAGRWAPRSAFAEVFVAELGETVGWDDYVGVYEVLERIEVGNDRVDITQLEPGDVAEPEVTGGWLFKEDRLGPGEYGFTAGGAGGLLQFQQPFAYESPKESVLAPEQAAWLTAELDELGVALTSPGFVHPTTGRHYDDLVDVDAFIDHHLINVFTKNPDAFRLSGYFHQDRLGELAAGPVWDFDRTMGCASDDRADDPTGWDASGTTSDTTFVFDHGFYGGLFDDPVFRDRWVARLQDLLDTELSVPNVHAVIDGFALRLDEAAPRNARQWPDWPPRGGSWQAEVDSLKAWTEARHDWMQACLTQPDPIACR